ncbi:twin-arginine translocase subunit TatC [Streptomyces carpaticus]|uniref:Sec-independent protein translocase protein TatC n=1 Tax=Streptomyces carpaticus TaxID=285558 RepID=A0ABV4ZNI4_9ACTN
MLKAARKKAKDPEGRMPLTEHLRELRNRLAISVLAVVVITVVALFFAKSIMNFITEPLPQCIELEDADPTGNRCATLTQAGLTSPFATYIKVSLMVGFVLASPVWLYQAWGFMAPGLHKNEKKYTRAVVAVGVPLFLFGAYFAYWLLPRAIPVLLSFSADGAENLVSVDDILDITVRMAIAFGFAFELPLVLVMLNFGGVVSGKRMLGWWRGMVVGIAIFAAAITPTDIMSMIALQVPVTGLYFLATGIALINDYRRRRNDPEARLGDDEASNLDLTPSRIDGPEDIGRPGRGGYDDAT